MNGWIKVVKYPLERRNERENKKEPNKEVPE